MENLPLNTYSDWLMSESNNEDQFLDLCEEYVEISLGLRKPTDSEMSKSNELSMRSMVGDIKLTAEDRVRIFKYPHIDRFLFPVINDILKFEYSIYDVLSDNREYVEGPYIPMFRYERLIQRDLLSEGELPTAIIRQISLFHTYFRLKSGIERRHWFEKLGWKRALHCAYRGENILNTSMYLDLTDVWNIRCNYAHEWRVYMEDDIPVNVKEVYGKGIRVLTKLLDYELKQEYEKHSDKPISQRLPSHCMRRESSTIEAGPMRTTITGMMCDNCGESFDPRASYKRCPYCGSRHDYLEQFS